MEITVKFVDYPKQFKALENRVLSIVRDTLANGDLILRSQLSEFETRLAQFVGTRYALGFSNCSDALRLTLLALGIGPGDEVITVSHTFVATIAAVHHVGATPVLVDVGTDHNIDVDLVEAAVSCRSRAILPVHLNGRLCDVDALTRVATRHGLVILEDSAQALGASFSGRNGGSIGIAGAFSFYPAKMLGAYGDGGAVTTDDAELMHRLRLLRNHGRATQDDLDGWGFNCRLDNLQAAILNFKLDLLPEWIRRRRDLAGRYHEALDGIDDIVRPISPSEGGQWFDVYENYVLEAEERDRLVDFLAEQGIETLVSWRLPLHRQPTLGLSVTSLPRTDRLAERVISLPLHTELEDWQTDYVAAAIRKFYGA